MNNYLISGSSSGIGKVLANQLANEGNHDIDTFHQTEVEKRYGINCFYPDVTTDFGPDYLPEPFLEDF